MKKFILMLVIAFAALASSAQVKTITLPTLKADVNASGSLTWDYTGLVSDTLSTNQDTIQIAILLNKSFPVNYYLKSVLAPRAGADTTVIINIKGKMFSTDSYSLIETVTTSAITASASVVIESMTDADYTQTIVGANDVGTLVGAVTTTVVGNRTVTPVVSIKPYYRYLMIEYIISGNDQVGTGIKLTSLKGMIQAAN